MFVPYFGPDSDPDTGELRRPYSLYDIECKIHYTVMLNGSGIQFFGGIKNILNSYQNDFDTRINRDPFYVYGPGSSRTVYLGIRFGNNL